MATRKFTYIDTDGVNTEQDALDDIALGGLAIDGSSGGNIDLSNGAELLGLPATPSQADAATSKTYVDSVAAGLVRKESVRVRTDGEVDNTWTSSGSGVGKTITAPTNAVSFNDIDGVTLVVGNRVLVADYNATANSPENGIYEVTALGDGSTTSFELTRATDADTDDEVDDGMTVWAGEGTTYADSQWTLITNDPITIDTTGQEFTQTAGPGLFVGGDGIDITGSTISADLAANGGLEFATGEIQIDADATRGVSTDASGLFVKLAAAGAGTGGIEFDGSGDLQVNLTSLAGLELTATGLQALVDGSTIQINGSGELEVLASSDSNRIANEFNVNEAIAVGDMVQWSGTADRVEQSDADRTVSGRQKPFGVAETAQASIGSACTIISEGVATGVISSATPGDRYYLASGGGLTATAPTGSVEIVQAGFAKNATDLYVQVDTLGRRSA